MTAITSVALKSEQRKKLIGKLEEKSGKKVILSEKIDPLDSRRYYSRI